MAKRDRKQVLTGVDTGKGQRDRSRTEEAKQRDQDMRRKRQGREAFKTGYRPQHIRD